MYWRWLTLPGQDAVRDAGGDGEDGRLVLVGHDRRHVVGGQLHGALITVVYVIVQLDCHVLWGHGMYFVLI